MSVSNNEYEMHIVKISVRKIIEFVYRHGDLDNRFTSSIRAVEGTKAHQKIQNGYKSKTPLEQGITYDSEVSLKLDKTYKEFKFIIEGRADGIILKDGFTTIDEIKTVNKSLAAIDENYNPLHMYQAKCYAYMYGIQNKLESLGVQLTYYNIDDGGIKFIKKKFSIDDLEKFFENTLKLYYKWIKFSNQWERKRNLSIKDLSFPFKSYRTGQRKLAVAVYYSIRDGKRLFVQAPTGIGKTVSTIFPSLKALGENKISKIFYLTARNITGVAAESIIKLMSESGLKLKTIVITAKEKICFQDEVVCNPEICKFARGHYDRVNKAIFDAINDRDLFTMEHIIFFATKYEVCPFELSLDLSLFCDMVICDYNYAFDPRVYLKRFFDSSPDNKYLFLIDEAHNLLDRSREMFSADIFKKPFLNAKKLLKGEKNISKTINKINKYMLDLRKKCEECGKISYDGKKFFVQNEGMNDLYFIIRKFSAEIEKWIIRNQESLKYQIIMDLYFEVNSFIKISESYSTSFMTYVECTKDDVKVKIMCIDPSQVLNIGMKRARSSILFSATFSPIKYFKEILGGREDDYHMILHSPFDTKNREIIILGDISTVYKYREKSYCDIITYTNNIISQKTGNYIIFFPSYSYMKKVYEMFIKKYPDVKSDIQSPGMNKEDKEKFIKNFRGGTSNSFLVFAVLGGMFSEGIDLKKDRLIGVIIVGVGFPQLCIERDVIKNYFNSKNGMGYEYSYIYPGMNKVLQAAGRVIRTEQDRGIIALMDERFLKGSYKKLFPEEWYPNHVVKSGKEVEIVLRKFWNSKDEFLH